LIRKCKINSVSSKYRVMSIGCNVDGNHFKVWEGNYMSSKKWWHEPLRISAVQCNYDEDSYEILKEHVVKRDFNTEQLLHLTAEGHMAYYVEELHGVKLEKYLEEAHKNNIREIVYVNVHCITKNWSAEHPDWVMLDKSGKGIIAYEIYYLNCVNSSWFDFFKTNLEKLCRHDIDGIFLDGPVFSTAGCYCEACRERFLKTYNKSILDATPQELTEFKVDSVTEYMKKTNEIVKGINPNILLYINNSALRADVTGSNTRKVEPYVDMLGAEGGFLWVDKNTSLYHAGAMAKHLEAQAKGKPTVTFFAGDQKPFSYYMHTAAETKILFAQSWANGSSVWYGIHAPTYIMNTPGGRAAEIMNKFHKQHEKYYKKSTTVSKIAIMWSMDSANNYSSSVSVSDFTNAQKVGAFGKKGNHYNAFMGFYEMLSRSHIQFDVVDEKSIIDGDLYKYDMIILPTCGCIEDETAAGIRKFVAEGGKIISTFDTGFYTGKGQSHKSPVLGDVMGIGDTEGITEYSTVGTGFHKIADVEWIQKGLSAPLIPAPDFAVNVTPSKEAEVLGWYLEPMKSRYVALPENRYPAILVNSYGKGTSIYVTGTSGEFFHSRTIVDYRILFNNIIKNFTESVTETDAPATIDIVVRNHGENRYVVHVINMTGEMIRPIERIIPVRNVKISVNVNKSLSKVKWINNNLELSVDIKDGKVEFTIPEIGEYELFSIE
jgi:hypothetical protein